MKKPTLVLTINSEFALSYEQLVIAAMKVDWYRRPDDTKASTKRKFIESLTQELRQHGEDFFVLEPFAVKVNTGRDDYIEYDVELSDWLDSPEEYEQLNAAVELLNELF